MKLRVNKFFRFIHGPQGSIVSIDKREHNNRYLLEDRRDNQGPIIERLHFCFYFFAIEENFTHFLWETLKGNRGRKYFRNCEKLDFTHFPLNTVYISIFRKNCQQFLNQFFEIFPDSQTKATLTHSFAQRFHRCFSLQIYLK